MRPDAIRTFPAGYHGTSGARNDFRRWGIVRLVASARTLLGALGLGIAIVGIAVAWSGVDRFVDDLHEETAMRNAFLVVFANPSGMNRRMIAWLERELDALPRDAEPAGVEDHLVV